MQHGIGLDRPVTSLHSLNICPLGVELLLPGPPLFLLVVVTTTVVDLLF